MNQSAANGKKNFDLDILRSLGIFIVSQIASASWTLR